MKFASSLKYSGLIWIAFITWGCGPKPAGTSAFASRSASSILSRSTYYYLAIEDPSAEKTIGLYHARTKERIATVSKKFAAELRLQGSGKLSSGLVVGYSRAKSDGISALPVDSEWGQSASDEPLVPFRTIAVDPRTFPLGSVVLIRETIGMPLPDGSLHDGIWKAVDTGGAIKNRDIDFFVGRKEWGTFLDSYGVIGNRPLTLEILH
jgi:3D (Asp-Asp-Asp) domain-containing protein